MPTEQFTIPKRPGWGAGIEVTIECDPLAFFGVKLGLAVRAAYRSGAVLSGAVLRDAVLSGAVLSGAVLSGADLRDAVLSGADLRDAVLSGAVLSGAVLRDAVLSGAVLRGADLSDADLRGADLRGEKITRVFASITRLDGYTFLAAELEAGGAKIAAGCRWLTPVEYRDHIASEYPGTPKAAETLAIVTFIEQRMADLGIVAATELEAA